MKALAPQRLKAFVCQRLKLSSYLRAPGDQRSRPQIPAQLLLWSQLVGLVLREVSYHGVEALVRSPARTALGIHRGFGDDALSYFTQRMNPGPTRQALAQVLRQAKRNKAFDQTWRIGLALDGTGAGHCSQSGCRLCHPIRDKQHRVTGYNHHFSLISVVGTGLSLPFDVEPYGPQDSEYAASQRLLQRTVQQLGGRFADYVVADSLSATAPFLHLAGDLGLRVVARLKSNLPQLWVQAQQRFTPRPPRQTFRSGPDRVEIWDGDDFDPWDNLRWTTVRVIRYRQYKPDGTIYEAYWLTDFPKNQISAPTLYRLAKSRWEIENQGFNDGKNRYGMQHLPHHHENSLLIHWLLICLALTLERLYRLRSLRRGTHAPLSPIDFLRRFRLSLGRPAVADTS
jgi:Transposase DDE domain